MSLIRIEVVVFLVDNDGVTLSISSSAPVMLLSWLNTCCTLLCHKIIFSVFFVVF